MGNEVENTNQNIGYTQRKTNTEDAIVKYILEACKQQGFITKEAALKITEGALGKLSGTNEEKLADAVTQMENLADMQKEPGNGSMVFEGLSSGFPCLDNYTKGFKPGEIVVVGGYPHKGKSTFMMDWCFNFAKQGVDVAYFAFDDTRDYVKSRVKMLGKGMSVDLSKYEGRVAMFPKAFQPIFEEDKTTLATALKALTKVNPNFKVVVVDMLNTVLDTVKDRDGNSFTSLLQRVAEEVGVTLFLICRLREANGLTQAARAKQAVAPDINSIYGDSRTVYVAGKVITLSTSLNYSKVPMQGVSGIEKQYVALHVVKSRGGILTSGDGGDGNDVAIIYELSRGIDSMSIKEIGVEEIVTPSAR